MDMQKVEKIPVQSLKSQVGMTFFGQEVQLDLFGCDPEVIRSGEKLLEYVDQLCELIDMKKYGKPFLERFALGDGIAAGYSVAQMIETSLISGHFSEGWNSAYLNIFSCKIFDEEAAREFSMKFFKAKDARMRVAIR